MRKYFEGLRVGVAETMNGGLAIGGDGIWSEPVKAVAKAHGMRIHKLTGEWFSADAAFVDVAASLEAAL